MNKTVIGIELNHVVRDINSQILKYFKKDIKKDFDDKNVNLNEINFIEKLPFKTNKLKNEFLYVDYPYEIFGCARAKYRNIAHSITNWFSSLNELDNGVKYEGVHFSLLENALSIQSSYYFLSKIGSRIRETHFPEDGVKMWECCDVLITCNERIIKNKPEGKVAILIKCDDNAHLEKYADFTYNNILEIINDDDFVNKIETVLKNQHKKNIFSKISDKIKKLI